MIRKVTITETIQSTVMVDTPDVESAKELAAEAINHFHQVDEHTVVFDVEEVLDTVVVEDPVWSKPSVALEVIIP